jgi:two-component system, chemotaxis family, protein-glutamate methylesterase/glutaminase
VRFELIAVGASLGGLQAVETLLSGLPQDFPVPVAVVQHRRADAGDRLRVILQRHTTLRVREPHDKEAVLPGRVYLAPPDYHLLVEGTAFTLSTEGPVSYARPSIDVLLDSASDAYGAGLIGVILTGANHDGAYGAKRVKERGGLVLVQDPATAESAVMPRAAISATQVDYVLPLPEIAPCLVNLCSRQ